MCLIRLKNVSKIYNYNKKNVAPTHALENANIDIRQHEMIAILGKSGAGKSTLLHILGCLDVPTSGDYFFQGENIKNKSDKQLAVIRNEKIGFILQDFGLIEFMSVYENISVPIAFSKKRPENVKKKCEEVLEKVGMEKLMYKQVSLLSGGERQRVAIARAVINNPDVILADEPTGSLDTANGQNILNIFRQLNNEGKTIILVTHDLSVSKCCARNILITDGKTEPSDT